MTYEITTDENGNQVLEVTESVETIKKVTKQDILNKINEIGLTIDSVTKDFNEQIELLNKFPNE